MTEFEKAYKNLNALQREAVNTTQGPVLVIAGPGTGKTQLISTRVGHILRSTDALPSDILALTFTEAGVDAMRQRLVKLLGQDAYAINLSTYHAFGGEILRRWPEYFEDEQLQLVDELSVNFILRDILARLPYDNPLKFADNYIKELVDFISDSKRALLSPDDIQAVAEANLKLIEQLNKQARTTLNKITRVSKKAVPLFEKLLSILKAAEKGKLGLPQKISDLASYGSQELKLSIEEFNASMSTSALSEWKKKWLAKDSKGAFIFNGKRLNSRLKAAAGIYKAYAAQLKSRKLYDYDDMILRAIGALEGNPEFKYTLAEHYQYIMLDEFQDTNPAQMKLVELLTDHPVHEGRPNLLAVGDDDQAIYAFQGADHTNMAYFAKAYKNVKVVSLAENYRSHPELLSVSQNISVQIKNRLHHNFRGINKSLKAVNSQLPKPPLISARQFKSDAAQYDWIAGEIKKLISKKGILPAQIAVLAPKHKHLVPLLPYLASKDIPAKYEKRESVLEEPIILQLEQMSRLVLALSKGNESLAKELWPQVLSYDFWALPTEKIWRLSWEARSSHEPWTAIVLNDPQIAKIATFFLRLKDLLPVVPLEQMLDALLGMPEISDKLKLPLRAPMFEYYFAAQNSRSDAPAFTAMVSHLSILRSGLLEWQRSSELKRPSLEALMEFIEGHRAAGINILDKSPYQETDNAVNLLTAYGAKGREFRAVFVIAAQDEVWGSASRNQGNRISLPANLQYIRYQGASEDERLRLLFVAVSRAMTHLYLTSYAQTLAGKPTTPLKYLDVRQSDNGDLHSVVLPKPFSQIQKDEADSVSAEVVENYWHQRHQPPYKPSLKTILRPQLERYQLSPTHLNQFVDIVNAGPETFFLHSILGFPTAANLTNVYGTAAHNSLKWLGQSLSKTSKLPSRKQLLEMFAHQLSRGALEAQDYELLLNRGQGALAVWRAQAGADLRPGDKYEYDFKNEGVVLGRARLSGKVDRLIINEKARSITVLDYKTGQSYRKWQRGVVKLHKFRQQLLFYKLLVEGSARFASYRVEKGVIEFVEPDEEGHIVRLELPYDDNELNDLKALIKAVWQAVQKLDWPETTKYPATIAGIRAFESDLKK